MHMLKNLPLIPLAREALIYSKPFGLSLSKPLIFQEKPFDKLRANGFNQRLPRVWKEAAKL